MVIEGDFVPGVAGDKNPLKPETGFNVFPFPSIDDSPDSVVGGGDLVVMFKDNPVAKAFIEYLTTPEASEIWAERGGFSSPNKKVDKSVYPDPIQETTAGAIGERGGLPLRPVRPAAVRVRRHRRPGSLQAVPGLPGEPAGHRRDHEADGGSGSEGVRLEAWKAGAASRGAARCGGSPERETGAWRKYALAAGFLAPAAFFLLIWIVYPAISTIYRSFFDKTGDEFVWFDNYKNALHERSHAHRDQEQRHLAAHRAGVRDGDWAHLRRPDRAGPLVGRVQDGRLHADGDLGVRGRR